VPSKTFKARLFYDEDRNGVYRRPVDAPLPRNSRLDLVGPGDKVVASTKIGANGLIAVKIPKLAVGTKVLFRLRGAMQPLGEVIVTGRPFNLSRFPLRRPPPPTANGTFVTFNSVTVNGYGVVNYTALIYINGTQNGTMPIGSLGPSGFFDVTSVTYLTSGTTTIAIAQRDLRGLVSKPVSAGVANIPFQPLAIGRLNANKTFSVDGFATPRNEIRVYGNKILLGLTYAIPPLGNFSFNSPYPLPIGTNVMTVTQTNHQGESNHAWMGAMLIELPSPPEVYDSIPVVGKEIKVEGIGGGGATVRLYSNWMQIGSELVAVNGQVGYRASCFTSRLKLTKLTVCSSSRSWQLSLTGSTRSTSTRTM